MMAQVTEYRGRIKFRPRAPICGRCSHFRDGTPSTTVTPPKGSNGNTDKCDLHGFAVSYYSVCGRFKARRSQRH